MPQPGPAPCGRRQARTSRCARWPPAAPLVPLPTRHPLCARAPDLRARAGAQASRQTWAQASTAGCPGSPVRSPGRRRRESRSRRRAPPLTVSRHRSARQSRRRAGAGPPTAAAPTVCAPPGSSTPSTRTTLIRSPIPDAVAVQAEQDRPSIPGAIKIVRDDHGHAFGHGTDGRPWREQLSTHRENEHHLDTVNRERPTPRGGCARIPAGCSSADHHSEVRGLDLYPPPESHGIGQSCLRAGPCPMPAQTTTPGGRLLARRRPPGHHETLVPQLVTDRGGTWPQAGAPSRFCVHWPSRTPSPSPPRKVAPADGGCAL